MHSIFGDDQFDLTTDPQSQSIETPALIFESITDLDRDTLSGRVVFTNGCFDLLHAGHVQYLEQARALGDMLVLGLNSDASVRMLKGESRPINTWHDRARVLAALRWIDLVIGFDQETPIQLIQELRPDVICKGGDYQIEQMIGRTFVESYGGEVKILPFLNGYSTTDIISRSS